MTLDQFAALDRAALFKSMSSTQAYATVLADERLPAKVPELSVLHVDMLFNAGVMHPFQFPNALVHSMLSDPRPVARFAGLRALAYAANPADPHLQDAAVHCFQVSAGDLSAAELAFAAQVIVVRFALMTGSRSAGAAESDPALSQLRQSLDLGDIPLAVRLYAALIRASIPPREDTLSPPAI